jgi:hypothetical protein
MSAPEPRDGQAPWQRSLRRDRGPVDDQLVQADDPIGLDAFTLRVEQDDTASNIGIRRANVIPSASRLASGSGSGVANQ